MAVTEKMRDMLILAGSNHPIPRRTRIIFSYAHPRILKTGRTHQIRVHMAHIGHPVVGDPVYGVEPERELGLQGQCLHAKQLEFSHPVSGERMSFKAELPEVSAGC